MKFQTLIILSLVALNTGCVFGQKNNLVSKNHNNNKIQFGVNFSSDLCFRTLQNNDGRNSSDVIISQRNNLETPKFGYTSGVNIDYQFRNNWSVETGLQYSNKGYETRKNIANFIYPSPSNYEQYKIIDHFHCLDIPLKINFRYGNHKIRLLSSFGITPNILLKQNQTIIFYYSDRIEKQTTLSNFYYNTFNISPSVSLGVDYKINQHYHVRIEPTFRYGILKIIDAPITGHLYNLGLNLSLYLE